MSRCCRKAFVLSFRLFLVGQVAKHDQAAIMLDIVVIVVVVFESTVVRVDLSVEGALAVVIMGMAMAMDVADMDVLAGVTMVAVTLEVTMAEVMMG